MDEKNIGEISVRKIPGFDFFWISAHGDVWSESRQVPSGFGTIWTKAKWLKTSKDKSGHLKVTLCEHRKMHYKRVHVLVALTWIGHPPFEGAMVLHKNDDKDNNHFSNLKYGTHLENMRDRHENGGIFNSGNAIQSVEQLREIYLATKTKKMSVVAKEFGVGYHVVETIKYKHYWSYFTDQWDKDLNLSGVS